MNQGESVAGEREHRRSLWSKLSAWGNPPLVPPAVIAELSLHRGQMGVFRDKERTARISGNEAGIAVGLLHTGAAYEDEISDRGVVYHYPATQRGLRDTREVASIRACRDLRLPLFVIIAPQNNPGLRRVQIGWVQELQDDAGLALVLFSETEPEAADLETPEVAPSS